MIEHPQVETPMSLDVMKEALHELNRMIFGMTINSELVTNEMAKMKVSPLTFKQAEYDHLRQTKLGLEDQKKGMETKRELIAKHIVESLPEPKAK